MGPSRYNWPAWPASSIWQSRGLLIPWLQVRVLCGSLFSFHVPHGRVVELRPQTRPNLQSAPPFAVGFSFSLQGDPAVQRGALLMHRGKICNEAGTLFYASLVPCGGDGGNRTRVREIRTETSTSLAGPCSLARGVAADRATPGPSRWEPKLPLKRSYRHGSAARRFSDARPPAYRRKTGADVTVYAVSLSLGRIRQPMVRRPLRPAGQESKCCWHFGVFAPLLTGSERPGLPSVLSLPRRSLSSPRQLYYSILSLC
jgi:hypothetical protein